MMKLEHTIKTARVLLDEATHIYRGESGGVFTPEELISLARERLAPYGIAPCFNPETLELDIISTTAEGRKS